MVRRLLNDTRASLTHALRDNETSFGPKIVADRSGPIGRGTTSEGKKYPTPSVYVGIGTNSTGRFDASDIAHRALGAQPTIPNGSVASMTFPATSAFSRSCRLTSGASSAWNVRCRSGRTGHRYPTDPNHLPSCCSTCVCCVFLQLCRDRDPGLAWAPAGGCITLRCDLQANYEH